MNMLYMDLYTCNYSLRQAMAECEHAKASLALANENKANASHGNAVVARVLTLSKGANAPLKDAGVRGRLGDLGSIDKEYDVAIRLVLT